jgi:hypothetical protein
MATPLNDRTRPAPVLDPPAEALAPRAPHRRPSPEHSGAHRAPRRRILAVVRRTIAGIIGTRTQEQTLSTSSS